jgi:hypothetical protein
LAPALDCRPRDWWNAGRERAMRGRLISLGIVAALHVAIIAALLTLSHERIVVPRVAPSSEVIWFLPPPPKKKIVPAARNTGPEPGALVLPPREALPDYHGITIPPPAAVPSLGGLHGLLFGCADLDHLSPEERAHCGSALAVAADTVDFRDGVNRSRSAALWERGRLRKNGPLLLPCMSTQQTMVDVICLAKGAIAGGFKPEEQPLFADTPETVRLPNNGDPPRAGSLINYRLTINYFIPTISPSKGRS